MKKILGIICLTIALAMAGRAQERPEHPDVKVKFLNSYEEALQESASTG